jgi:hypothetical protein
MAKAAEKMDFVQFVRDLNDLLPEEDKMSENAIRLMAVAMDKNIEAALDGMRNGINEAFAEMH